MPSYRLSELNIYPIKAARGISLASSQLEERGLQYDRRWMVVDREGRFLSQRKIPRMSLIHVDIRADHLAVSAQGMPPLQVPLAIPLDISLRAQVHDDFVEASDVGRESAAWFTLMLGQECRLVAMPDTVDRFANTEYAPENTRVSFADAYPVLLISQASLDDLNSRLAQPVPMNRFRPNIVVDGCRAYEEDSWKRIRIGSISFLVVKPCSRCTVPTVDQDSGIRGIEPIRTLLKYRSRDGKVQLGQNLVHENRGVIRVTDQVEVERR